MQIFVTRCKMGATMNVDHELNCEVSNNIILSPFPLLTVTSYKPLKNRVYYSR